MTVVSLRIESSGWILAVRGSWGATPGAWEFGAEDRVNARFLSGGVDQFPLDPHGNPKLVVNVQDAGFGRVGGLPVASSARPRTVIATKPLRLAHPNASQLDEFDHGDGTRTIRFALSDRIYAGSTVVSASFLSGWKAGQGGGVINTVTNNSTRTPPPPLFKWANEPWPYVGGTAGSPVHTGRVEVLIATHHPEHDGSNLHQACAALMLRAFDGTTAKDFYFTAPQTSPLYGDNLRCWGGEIDLSGLNPGPITVHATVYPWVGQPRSTGVAHSTSDTAALSPDWGSPFHLWYDPTGSVWPRKFVAIDPIGGTTTQANVVWHNSVAAANAAAASTKPANFVTACRAVQAGVGGGLTLPARNGFLSHTNCGAWWEVLLPAGASEPTGDLSGMPRSGPGYLVVRGNPSDPAPRTNCILRAGAAQRTWNSLNRMKFADLRLELGNFHMFNCSVSPTTEWATLENVDIRLRSGATDGFAIYNGVTHTSHFNVDARNINTTGQQLGWLFRNVTRTALVSSSSLVSTMIGVKINVPQAGDIAPTRVGDAFSSGSPNVDDVMLWNCEAYAIEGGLLAARAPAFGGDLVSFRWAVVNTLFERAGNNGTILAIGETTNSQLRDSIFESVTFVGARFNWHNDAEILGTTAGNAVRVNNSPSTLIRIGLLNHGLTTGDTINVSGFTGTNGTRLNVTGAAVTVLDANRFEYSVTTGVTSTSSISGTGTVTYVTGAMAGQPARQIVRDNLRHTNNVIRYSVFDRNATKHDLFNNASNLTGSWELLYGVGFRGNVNAQRGVASWAQFQYAFYGLNADLVLDLSTPDPVSQGVNWHGYVDDRSSNGPQFPSATFNGDYRADTVTLAPFKPSRMLGRGNAPAVIDRDGRGGTRGATFDSGALGRLSVVVVPNVLQPAPGTSPHLGDTAGVRWRADLASFDAVSTTGGREAALSIGSAQPTLAGRLLQVEPEESELRVEPE